MDIDRHKTPEYQAFSRLLSPSDDGGERWYVDVAVAVDDVIAQLQESGRLELALHELDAALLVDRSDDELEMAVRPMDPVPEGLTCRAWLTWLQGRARQALADPAAIPRLSPDETHPRLWRHTRQTRAFREGVFDRIVDLVAGQHAEAVNAWFDGTGWQGWHRVHLYADLSAHSEELAGPGATAIGEVAPMLDGQLFPERARPATHAVVVLNQSPSGEFGSLEAHPEMALDESLRAEYPDLCHWFGAFHTRHGGAPAHETYAANRSTWDPARSKVRDQLTLLLTQDDATIHEVLVATGSYTAPSGPLGRHWVDRQLWRLDAWDWRDPRA